MAVRGAIEAAKAGRAFNSLITETFNLALAQEVSATSGGKKPFSFVAKDCFAVENISMTCASNMLKTFNAPYSSTVVSRLINHGGCLVGKANMDSFAMGSTSTHSDFGPVKNSLSDIATLDDDWLIAGGSSGGCAVAVQLGIADVALGSDTGGSTRNPAAFHGICGFKPSYGTLSRHGLVPLANSFDVPAIFARTVDDCEKVYRAAAGIDSYDSTSIDPKPQRSFDLANLTVGVPREYRHETLSDDSAAAWDLAVECLRKAGCKVVEVSLPHTDYSIVCYHILAETDIASNMARFDGVSVGHRTASKQSSFLDLLTESRTEALNDTIRRRIFVGNFFNVKENRGIYFQQAAKVRRLIKQDFDDVFKNVDFLVTPVTSHSAPKYSVVRDARFKSRQRQDDYFTQPANMAGLPAISVPGQTCSAGLPLGVQVLTNYLEDYLCLGVARHLQKMLVS